MSACDYYMINAHDHQIGLIEESESISGPDFELCYWEKVFPYYYGSDRAGYLPGKDSLRLYFETHFENEDYKNQSGYITVRFMINCKGEAGQFQLLQTGTDYRTKEFDAHLSDHLFELVRGLENWKPLKFNGDGYDSFFHLTFKIDNGEIAEILP